MFGLSFSELMVIGVVALIVVGPERLPKLAQTIGLLVGRAQRYVNDLKSDLEKEMNVDELKKMKDDVQHSASTFEEDIRANFDGVKEPFNDIRGQSADLEQKLKEGFDSALKGKKTETSYDNKAATSKQDSTAATSQAQAKSSSSVNQHSTSAASTQNTASASDDVVASTSSSASSSTQSAQADKTAAIDKTTTKPSAGDNLAAGKKQIQENEI